MMISCDHIWNLDLSGLSLVDIQYLELHVDSQYAQVICFYCVLVQWDNQTYSGNLRHHMVLPQKTLEHLGNQDCGNDDEIGQHSGNWDWLNVDKAGVLSRTVD